MTGNGVPRAPARRGGSDQRRENRSLRTQNVQVVPYRDGVPQPPVSGWVCDTSTRGVGLIVERPLEHGQQFVLTLKDHAGTRSHRLYSVVRCRRCGDTYHQVGAELVALTPASPATPPQSGAQSDQMEAAIARLRRSILS